VVEDVKGEFQFHQCAIRQARQHRRVARAMEAPSLLYPSQVFLRMGAANQRRKKKKLSKPWAVSLADDGLFAFGGIWDRWKRLDEKKSEIVGESFSIITTDPNEVLEPFHNRCPLIIEPKDYERWLAPAEPSHLPIDLVRTYPAEEMKAWRVAKLQGNGPHLLEPLTDSLESARFFIAEQ
jgi:putative SOS response-associated peptidase YedK